MEIRMKLGKRRKNKASFGISRVGHDEIRRLNDFGAVQQKIDIDRAGTFGCVTDAAGIELNIQTDPEQFAGF